MSEGKQDPRKLTTPVFFINDPREFDDFIHTRKGDPRTTCKNPAMV